MSQRDTGWVAALLLLGAGGARQRPLRVPDRRDRDAAGDGVRGGLPALAHVRGRRRSRRRTTVDAFVPPFAPPDGLGARPGRAARVLGAARAGATTPRSSATSPTRWTRRASVIETVARRVRAPLRPAEGRCARGRPATPTPSTALVTIGTIGDTALELLEDDDDLLLVRVHAYRPFPAGRAGGRPRRARRTSASSTARPRSARSARSARDVRSLRLRRASRRRTSICGVGGTEVTPDTLRWALRETRSGGPSGASSSRCTSRRGCERWPPGSTRSSPRSGCCCRATPRAPAAGRRSTSATSSASWPPRRRTRRPCS